MQLLNWTAQKTNSAGRLILMSVLGGVLVGAMALPVVAATGILVRNTSDKFTSLPVNASSLPARSAIYDSDGKLITYLYGVDLGPGETATGIDRQPVTYSQISPDMVTAIVAIEDDRFWQHGGFDAKGTLRALINDIEGKAIQGGSTLEQQYVKNEVILQAVEQASAAPTQQAYQDAVAAAQENATAQNLSRKIDQLRMAVQVAQTLSKPDIVAGYLNDAYFGNGAWGVEAAAETYFDTTAAKLTMLQAATLAGIVENPTAYDPLANPATSFERRNTVLGRIWETNPTALSKADAVTLENEKMVLRPGEVQSGCTASTAGDMAFFCDDVIHTMLLDKQLGSTMQARAQLLATGGLKIYTTVSEADEAAATQAVNHVLPENSQVYNPAGNAATEVLIQPGTGKVLAIAEDRPYGTGKGETEVDYAVNSQYGGGAGIQTGSSSKLFTLITALEQGMPIGSTITVSSPDTVTGYTDCEGNGTSQFNVVNSEGVSHNTAYSLYTGTTLSINVYYAHLEQQVGLCNTVKTAVQLGMTRVDGKSLLARDGDQIPADDTPSFTLGVVNVSPMSMAAAYAVPASGGMYCAPIVLSKIVNGAGKSLPVPSAGCHRAISKEVAEAVNYILQGVFTFPGATAAGGGLTNYEAAGKTGTSNISSGNGTPYAAFAGYTTALAGYVSVFNPKSPTGKPMAGMTACYQLEYGGQYCPGEMYGDNAPHEAWHMTFDHADLHGSVDFAQLPYDSSLLSQGDGQTVKQPCQTTGKKNNNNNNANNANNANCTGNGNGNTTGNNGGNGGNNGNGGNGGTGNNGNGNGNGNGNNARIGTLTATSTAPATTPAATATPLITVTPTVKSATLSPLTPEQR